MAPDDRPEGILGRISSPAEPRRAPASSVDVLLVHGDSRFAGKVAGLLRKHAHTVVEAATAAEAHATVREGCHPRLVVLDLDGASPGELSTLAALQAEPACAGTAFLALARTGGEGQGALRLTTSILKPVEAAELVEAVRRLCGAG